MATTTSVDDRERLGDDRGLEVHGIRAEAEVVWRPTTSVLYTAAIAGVEGRLAECGPLVVDTGRHTGRSPKDKFVVREPESEERIWWGSVNQPLDEERFEALREKIVSYLEPRDLYVVDAFAGADPAHRLGVRVVTYSAWHALFAKTLFIDPTDEELEDFESQALVLHAPALSADPERRLIGDDEHGWGDAGIFNIEGGCYAKVNRLS